MKNSSVIDLKSGYPWKGNFSWTSGSGDSIDSTGFSIEANLKWSDNFVKLTEFNGGINIISHNPSVFNVILTSAITKKIPTDEVASFEIIILDADGFPVACGNSKIRKIST